MAVAELEVHIPEFVWISRISRRHPETRFTVISYLPLVLPTGLVMLKIEGEETEQILEEIRKASPTRELHVVDREGEATIVSVKTDQAFLLPALVRSEVMIQDPFTIQSGIALWRMLSPRPQIAKLMEHLKEMGVRHSLRQLREPKERPRLSPRQAEVFTLAVKHGYYELPRRITLTQLAERLQVSKSTLSAVLRTAERNLLVPERVRRNV